MRDDTDMLPDVGFSLWSTLRFLMRERVRALASVGFMLIAVGAIHFQEQMSPVLDRLAHVCTVQATKTIRVANLAMMSAALPFFIRG